MGELDYACSQASDALDEADYARGPSLEFNLRHFAQSVSRDTIEGVLAGIQAGRRNPVVPPAVQAGLLRCIIGDPFAPVTLPLDAPCPACRGEGGWGSSACKTCAGEGRVCSWLRWNDGAVRKLAQAICDERAFERLPVLADALEDAGATDPDLLAHLRGPGPHVRGCWVVDLLLGKS